MRIIGVVLLALWILAGCDKQPQSGSTTAPQSSTAPTTLPDSGARATGGVNGP